MNEDMYPASEYLKVVAMYTAAKAEADQLRQQLAAEQRRSAEHWRELERLRELLQLGQVTK